MVIIVANRDDASAGEIARASTRQAAVVMTADDLVHGGWQWTPGAIDDAWIRAGGRRMQARAITAVVALIPAISVAELPMIDAGDRAYVATEMTAMLAAFLSELRCPVLNRPSPTRLDGPAWSDERWRIQARQHGICVVSSSGVPGPTSVPESNDAPVREVLIIGEQWFGRVPAEIRRRLHSLAELIGVRIFSVRFLHTGRRMELVGVSTLPRIDDDRKRSALWELLERKAP
jgi:hypothetical protein